MSKPTDFILWVLGVIFMGAVALLLLSLFHIGCAHVSIVKPDPNCAPTDMVRDGQHSVHNLADCYDCKGAKSCLTASNQWCCADPICSECEISPVPFDKQKVHDEDR